MEVAPSQLKEELFIPSSIVHLACMFQLFVTKRLFACISQGYAAIQTHCTENIKTDFTCQTALRNYWRPPGNKEEEPSPL